MMDDSSSRTPSGAPLAERMAYPAHPAMRRLAGSPIFLWRLGYGPLLGKFFLILTHIGRRSGRVRRTALEYHDLDGRIYVFNAWPQSDWYHNIQAQPRVTLQTGRETFTALARPLITSEDYLEAYPLVEQSLMLRAALKLLGVEPGPSGFLAARDQFQIVAFDRTDAPGPPALRADLKWLSPLVAAALGIGFAVGKIQRKKKRGLWQRLVG